MCKLTRAWVRFHLAKCSLEQVKELLFEMRPTDGPYGRYVPKKVPQPGELLWSKYCEPDAFDIKELNDMYIGFLHVQEQTPYYTGGTWYCHNTNSTTGRTEPRLRHNYWDTFNGRKRGFARFPMFNAQILPILQRNTESMTDEDRQLLKKARLSKD
jgi:hypothetical protein